MDVQKYYCNQDVKARMVEFLGGRTLQEATCMFLAQCDTSDQIGMNLHLPTELDLFISRGLDVSRSLWDKKWLIVHMDIEYVNYDFPAEPYLDPVRTFSLQHSAEFAIEKFLLEHGIAPLHMLSGRGHHFVWQINRNSAAFGKLTKLGFVQQHIINRYADLLPPVNMSIDSDLGYAFSGLGLIMEYVALVIRDEAQRNCTIPVELSALEVPPQIRGREMVSIDITEYGDLLHTRLIRIPFSLYLKPWQKCGILNEEIENKIPLMISIPLFEMDTNEGISIMRDLKSAAELASRAAVQIPDQSVQMLDLIRSYEKSDLFEYHKWFYSKEHEPPSNWSTTYDCIPLEILPPCTRHILENPNDLLLKPAGICQVVRVMLSLGWHPRHIAGLIRSKYERDYGWGREWYFYDAATRADFYTRIFTALIKCKKDNLEYFDCDSIKQAHYCSDSTDVCSMNEFKQSLQRRVQNERLACRPFNRLFLPDEYI
ncbi:MAG: hypothetical protein GXY77_17565 [Fibrobacter sp.]|nr:hypothetical protein [Fibrobacter sp.]